MFAASGAEDASPEPDVAVEPADASAPRGATPLSPALSPAPPATPVSLGCVLPPPPEALPVAIPLLALSAPLATPVGTPTLPGEPGEPVALPNLAIDPMLYMLRDVGVAVLLTPTDQEDLLQLPVVSEQDY